MSEYDLLLSNVLEMCRISIDTINVKDETRLSQIKIATHLNDAYLNIEKAKEELDKFKESYDADTRYKLLNKSHWELKNDKQYSFIIRGIDLRNMTVLYSYNLQGTSYLREDTIDKFLNDFE